jgi:WD40 repeat protein
LYVVCLNKLLPKIPKKKEILWTTNWSPDGKLIGVGGNVDTLKIFKTKNLKLYKSIPIGNTITRIKWHPTKNIIAVMTQTSKDKPMLINLDTDEKMELDGISQDGARGADWNFSGEYLAVGDNDGQILIYNFKGDLIRQFINESIKSITAIAWHPKKDILVTVGERIRMFNIDGKLLKSIPHREEETLLLCVSWHKSGDYFVTGDYGDNERGYEPLLQYWKSNGALIRSINLSKGEYRNLSWNSKGTRLATASDALRIWDTKGKLLSEGKSKDYLWGVSWNKKGNRIITSSQEQNIILWNSKAEIILTLE